MRHVLQAENVTKSFPSPTGSVPVLRNVTVAVRESEFVALTGPSGSGKTTFLHIAALLDRPTSGRLMFDDDDISGLDEDALSELRKHKVGMVFQRFHLLSSRTALQNVMFRFRYLEHDPSEARVRSEECLRFFGLQDLMHKTVRILSTGQMQRVAIARAVALRPRLLIADEPTGSLDSASSAAVMDCFSRLNREGIAVLMATHNERLLEYCSRRIPCLDGRIV